MLAKVGGIGKTHTVRYIPVRQLTGTRTGRYRAYSVFFLPADIAETLSKDMQKECLLGRTLTLKLKTASFEVFGNFCSAFMMLKLLFSYESCDFLETNQLSVRDYVAVSYGNHAESLNECPKTRNK
ncbi:hypothetical protein BHM03_00007987, partial [Ensete ventricosum]